jgi:transcriptional regulator with XRE-family HTH domain
MNKSQHTAKYKKLVRELKVARVRAGLTQLDVAAKLGVYTSFVSKCESGERKVDVIELAEFCHVYGLRVSQLLALIGIN